MQTDDQAVNLRLLAIDGEYMIALDVQFILADLNWCRVDVETTAQFETALAAGTGYDVVIIDPDPANLTRAEINEMIQASGARTIWSLAERPEENGALPDGVPWVLKPFSSRHILAALVEALQSPHPETARAVAAVLAESGP